MFFWFAHKLVISDTRLGVSHGGQVLVIAPGFGILANPQQTRCVEAAGFTVVKCFAPSPEDPGFDMNVSIRMVLDAIAQERPDVLMCASKGGAYLVELWHAHNVKISSAMINAHPRCWDRGLPQDTNIVIVQGSEEEVWPKERGYTVPELDSHGRQTVCRPSVNILNMPLNRSLLYFSCVGTR